MRWRWELRPAADRELRKLDRRVVESVLDALDDLASDMSANGRPTRVDTKKLKGMSDEFRLRVGNHRVRYGAEVRESTADTGEVVLEGVIVVFHVFDRREAY